MTALLSGWVLSSAQSRGPQAISTTTAAVPEPDPAEFLPPDMKLLKTLRVDFENRGVTDLALIYASYSHPDVKGGLRVLRQDAASGWIVAYEDSEEVVNGGGPESAFRIEKVGSAGGKQGVLFVLQSSGAGTSTDWHIVAVTGGRFVRLEGAPLRDRVLRRRRYNFMGYNGVGARSDLIVETVAGYSGHMARCCPDKPSLRISYRFTGNSIELDSVATLPFKPNPY